MGHVMMGSCDMVGKIFQGSRCCKMQCDTRLTNAAESIDGHIELLRLGDLL